MVVLQPRNVRFGTLAFDNVAFVSVDRVGRRVAKEWGDGGPFPTFVDVVEQEVVVRVAHAPARGELTTPTLGASATLSFVTSPGASDAGGRRVSLAAVVTSVRHSVGAGGVMRTIEFAATSSDGASDPVSISSVGGGA